MKNPYAIIFLCFVLNPKVIFTALRGGGMAFPFYIILNAQVELLSFLSHCGFFSSIWIFLLGYELQVLIILKPKCIYLKIKIRLSC